MDAASGLLSYVPSHSLHPCNDSLLILLLVDCTYVRAWITVKHHYSLAVDKAEHKALSKYLNACPDLDA